MIASNAPMSPESLGGSNEWSGMSRFQADGPYPNPRGPVSPPESGSPSGMMNGYPGGPGGFGGPSPPPSVGRSSTYARSESGRSIREDNLDAVLGEHYLAFRRYLAITSSDGRPSKAQIKPPVKARDKLLRLSSVQFFELSTDVFDELMRRQMRPPPPGAPHAGHPTSLPPEPNFHPKRNQARQKLSTLGSPRFRDLATDVFCELEKRIPAFVDSVSRPGAPTSRAGTPVNSMGYPRGPNNMRRPSDASSVRSGGPPRFTNDYHMPASPVVQSNNSFDRPLPKHFQSNTIVPNKSTMLEEDDDCDSNDDDDNHSFASRSRDSKAQSISSTKLDKKSVNDYEKQVQELNQKIEGMEIEMKKTDEKLTAAKDSENSRAIASNLEKEEWNDLRASLVGRLSDAESLTNSMRSELERLKEEHAAECRAIRKDIEASRQNNHHGGDQSALMKENEELRAALQEQQQVTEEARREARQFLEEMKALSLQHMPSWERQSELEKTVEQLEQQVRDWRNRYVRAKTQLRSIRTSSIGLTIEQDVGKYAREHGFTEANGLVKDVNVTRFQISIDELLRRARTEEPGKVIDGMKSVIANVRSIINDIEDVHPEDEELERQQQKLKSRVTATANNLITASKNYASAAGLSPVSLLDAAASHLVAALVELLRVVKIHTTAAAELEDDDDGSITPVESTGFFSNRTTTTEPDAYPKPVDSPLSPPPSFGDKKAEARDSVNSSAYSPFNSPRVSVISDKFPVVPKSRANGNGFMAYNPNKNPISTPQESAPQGAHLEDLKIHLEDQTALLVNNIQGLVGSIRGNASIRQINAEIESIAGVVDKVVAETEDCGITGETDRLSSCRQRLLEAGDHGKTIATHGHGDDDDDREWRMWTQTIPPIAFEIVRETKELVQHIDRLISPHAAEEFS
ncbi:hypothetical protein GGS21DRAFT_487236 [Xylaria nigripes]|nr:hypothetical protein GGS21DRAFT_487236 [Xylaria nigripes]